ncbi:hypothetical protein L1887_18385 [Cichorium endivia]|nr:hypothetical protein L1887_18385 [Cichorium endivia]
MVLLSFLSIFPPKAFFHRLSFRPIWAFEEMKFNLQQESTQPKKLKTKEDVKKPQNKVLKKQETEEDVKKLHNRIVDRLPNKGNNHDDIEELEKELNDLRHQEQDLFRNIRHDQNKDLQKGEPVKNQTEPTRSTFCNSGGVKEANSDLIDSTNKTVDYILKLH